MQTTIKRGLALMWLILCVGFVSPTGAAYPDRPITIVVPFAAGGTTDILARILAEHMSRSLAQQIVVENAPGAGGTTGATRVARALPDGYTLLMGNLGSQVASIALYSKLAYDPRTDFAPIMNSGATPMVVAARNDLPVKDFREFVAYVRANPTKLNFGTGGVGATSHLTCILLHSLLGVEVQHLPFRGSGPALNALIAGQIDYVCDQTVGIVPQIQGKSIKGLVVAVAQRVPVLPDVPTSAEQGLPAFQASGWNALFAPKGTPDEVIVVLNAAAKRALLDPAVRTRLLELGAELPEEAGLSPQALAALLHSEIDKWVPVLRASGVTAN